MEWSPQTNIIQKELQVSLVKSLHRIRLKLEVTLFYMACFKITKLGS